MSPAHTRAWIETRLCRPRTHNLGVARSHAGVDRNALANAPDAVSSEVARSHAGVDRNSIARSTGRTLSSPAHTRAWIETNTSSVRLKMIRVARSHAGVDRNGCHQGLDIISSSRPLTRGRGSKLDVHDDRLVSAVSPAHTRAWIETTTGPHRRTRSTGRPLTRGRGSKRRPAPCGSRRRHVARSHAGVDRNAAAAGQYTWLDVARSHAGVDRNFNPRPKTLAVDGRPLTRGRGSKPSKPKQLKLLLSSPAHTRAWIETIHGRA